jgi:hypothetical protein
MAKTEHCRRGAVRSDDPAFSDSAGQDWKKAETLACSKDNYFSATRKVFQSLLPGMAGLLLKTP